MELTNTAKAFKRANVVIHPGSSYETALAVDGAGDVPPSPIAVVRQWYVPVSRVSVILLKPGTSAAFGMPLSSHRLC